MHKKRFAFLSVVLAMLCAFALVFAACDNGESSGETPSTGDPFEGYVEVPAENAGSAPATISLNARTLSVAYGGTVQVTATVGNPVAGTVTWSVETPETGDAPITIADGATAQIDAEHATATVTLEGSAYTGETSYTVTATFAATGSESNTASASCEVTVGTRTVTVEVSGSASALYTDGEESEKSATLTAAVTGLSADETATVNWAVTEGAALVDLSATTGTEITVTAKDDAAVGSVTVTASVTYNDGQTAAQTASGTFTLSVTAHAMDYIAEINFDNDTAITSGTSVSITSLYTGISAVYGGGSGEVQSTTVHGDSGNALRIGSGQNAGAYFTLDFSGYNGVVVAANETVSISYWSYINGNSMASSDRSDGADWSSIATALLENGTIRSSLRYITMNSSVRTDASDTDNGNVWPSHADSAHAGNWAAMLVDSQWIYVTVEITPTQVNYYVNNVLQVCYDSATSPARNAITAVITDIRAAINGTGTLKMFGNKEGVHDLFIDGLRITKNISAAELYAAAAATE